MENRIQAYEHYKDINQIKFNGIICFLNNDSEKYEEIFYLKEFDWEKNLRKYIVTFNELRQKKLYLNMVNCIFAGYFSTMEPFGQQFCLN